MILALTPSPWGLGNGGAVSSRFQSPTQPSIPWEHTFPQGKATLIFLWNETERLPYFSMQTLLAWSGQAKRLFFFFNCLRLIYITTGNEKSYLLFTQHILLGKAHLKHTTNKCLIPRQYDFKPFLLLHSNRQRWALHKLRLYKYTNKHILTTELKGSHKIHSDKNTPLSFHDEMV